MPTELLSIEECAKRLREMAELTSKGSRNWDNFEGICLDVLNAAKASGMSAAADLD